MNKLLMALVIGLLIGVGATVFFTSGGGHDLEQSDSNSQQEPLYWVAPMDPDYRRDKPGKSPMGMDLIPVYDQGDGTAATGPGTIYYFPGCGE